MSTLNLNLSFYSDTSAAFMANDPVLDEGRVGVEIDTGLFKIGDGITPWSELTYAVINNRQTILLTLSTDEGNMLGHGSDGGLLVSASKLPAKQDLVDAFKPEAVFTEEPTTESAAIHSFKQLSLVVRNIINALGDEYQVIKNMDNATVVTTLATRIAEAVANKVTIADVIKDDVEASTSSWSSTQIITEINKAVTTALGDLVGTAPEALDTIYEIANQLLANGSVLELMVTAVGGAVRFEIEQALTVEQKERARSNIAALGKAEFGSYIDTGDKTVYQWFTHTLETGTRFTPVASNYLSDIAKSISETAYALREIRARLSDIDKYISPSMLSFTVLEHQANTNIWKKVHYNQANGNTTVKSELTNFNAQQQTFQGRVETYYDKVTLQVKRIVTYSLSYDGYGNLISETIVNVEDF